MKCQFSERYLQILWNERLLSVRAQTADGKALRVLSTGIWNRCAGPDFSNAAIMLDSVILRGDIEIHRLASEWFAHGHDRDDRYRQVALHVVWINDLPADGPRSTGLPTLELSRHLQSGWHQVLERVESAFYPHAREVPPGSCAMRWALTDDTALEGILEAAGDSRFIRKGAQILRECAVFAPDQILYERCFEALGYSGNRRQFRMLAQAVPLDVLRRCPDAVSAGALLFGNAGLLPDPTRDAIIPELRGWVKSAWHCWWASGAHPAGINWNHCCGRPFNSIFRRLAGGIFWLRQCDYSPSQWLAQCREAAGGHPRKLLKMLMAPAREESIWRQCYDFQHKAAREAALLGASRLADVAANIWLPFLGAQSECNGDVQTLQLIRNAWQLLPRQHSNLLLDEACHRFLSPPSRERQILRRAIHQQGMMDIYQKFCLALNHNCNECPFVTTGG